jgi:endonuclease/exonuclease/phosphatase family metal-dependent hydrolase
VWPFPRSHLGRYKGTWLARKCCSVQGRCRSRRPSAEIAGSPRGALVVELDLKQGGTLRIIASHFGLLRHSRAQQAKALVELLNTRDEHPTILLGDLNEWRLGNGSSLNTFRDAFGSLPPAVPSFPAGMPVLALDRIISNRAGLVDNVTAHNSALSRIASDHLPLKATVRTDILLGQQAG